MIGTRRGIHTRTSASGFSEILAMIQRHRTTGPEAQHPSALLTTKAPHSKDSDMETLLAIYPSLPVRFSLALYASPNNILAGSRLGIRVTRYKIPKDLSLFPTSLASLQPSISYRLHKPTSSIKLTAKFSPNVIKTRFKLPWSRKHAPTRWLLSQPGRQRGGKAPGRLLQR